jgi:hypothetical protein
MTKKKRGKERCWNKERKRVAFSCFVFQCPSENMFFFSFIFSPFRLNDWRSSVLDMVPMVHAYLHKGNMEHVAITIVHWCCPAPPPERLEGQRGLANLHVETTPCPRGNNADVPSPKKGGGTAKVMPLLGW